MVSAFVGELAARLEPEIARLHDTGFVQVLSEPQLSYRHRVLLGVRRTAAGPAAAQVYCYGGTHVVTTSGDRSFGGPLDLGSVDADLRAAGYGVAPRHLNPRREYRAELPRTDPGAAATLLARTLELLGAHDAAAVEVLVEPHG